MEAADRLISARQVVPFVAAAIYGVYLCEVSTVLRTIVRSHFVLFLRAGVVALDGHAKRLQAVLRDAHPQSLLLPSDTVAIVMAWCWPR